MPIAAQAMCTADAPYKPQCHGAPLSSGQSYLVTHWLELVHREPVLLCLDPLDVVRSAQACKFWWKSLCPCLVYHLIAALGDDVREECEDGNVEAFERFCESGLIDSLTDLEFLFGDWKHSMEDIGTFKVAGHLGGDEPELMMHGPNIHIMIWVSWYADRADCSERDDVHVGKWKLRRRESQVNRLVWSHHHDRVHWQRRADTCSAQLAEQILEARLVHKADDTSFRKYVRSCIIGERRRLMSACNDRVVGAFTRFCQSAEIECAADLHFLRGDWEHSIEEIGTFKVSGDEGGELIMQGPNVHAWIMVSRCANDERYDVFVGDWRLSRHSSYKDLLVWSGGWLDRGKSVQWHRKSVGCSNILALIR